MLFDSNILIAYLKGEPSVVDTLTLEHGMPLVTRDRGFRRIHELHLLEI
jgi:hypothetical protein